MGKGAGQAAAGADVVSAANALFQAAASYSDVPWGLPHRSMIMLAPRGAPQPSCPNTLSRTGAMFRCAVRYAMSSPSTSDECTRLHWSGSTGKGRTTSALGSANDWLKAALGRTARNGSTRPAGTTPAATYVLGPCQRPPKQDEERCEARWGRESAAEVLTPGLLQRTRANAGSADAWARVVARLDAGLPVAVAVLGGSFSESRGATGGWANLVAQWMRKQWPQASITLHNGAIGATGSSFFAMCAESRLPLDAHVIFLEHALNDGEQWPPVTDWRSLQTRATVYEVLVRRLLARKPFSPALLFLNWDRIGWCANLEASATYTQRLSHGALSVLGGVPWLATPQIAVDLIARWYGIPSLAPRNALWHKDCDDLNFRGAFCDSGGANGCGHLRPIGYEIVGRVVTSFLAETTARVRRKRGSPALRSALAIAPSATSPSSSASVESFSSASPAGSSFIPIKPVSSSALRGALLGGVGRLRPTTGRCTRGEGMESLPRQVLSGEWAYVRRDPEQPPGADKPGLLSLVAPSVMDLSVGGTPTGVVALGYLKSYDERMGEVEVRCARGCVCNASTLQGWHSRRSSVQAFGIVRTTPSEDCVLRMTHRPRTSGRTRMAAVAKPAATPSGAALAPASTSKFKLSAVVVPPWAVDPRDHDMASARGLGS